MKYWIRAVGKHINEQLLVSASTQEELRKELTQLLHIEVEDVSLTTEGIQRLLANEDHSVAITQVNVKTHLDKLEETLCGSCTGPVVSTLESSDENGALEKIILTRERVASIIDIRYGDAFHSAVKGAIVRVRDKQSQAYVIAPVVGVHMVPLSPDGAPLCNSSLMCSPRQQNLNTFRMMIRTATSHV